MKWLKKLNNPLLLGLEGFVAGAILFFATHPGAADSIVADHRPQSEPQQQRGAA